MTTLTAPQSAATATLREYPIQTAYRRRSGLYVAVVTGADDRYGVGRDFADGKPVKTRKVIEYGAGVLGDLPAWVVRRPDETCHDCGQARPVKHTGEDLIAAYQSGWQLMGRIFGADDLLAVHEAGPPGAPGAWAGDWCSDCEVTPTFGPGVCSSCETATGARDHLDSLPAGDVF